MNFSVARLFVNDAAGRLKDPWSQEMPTITGSGVYLVRDPRGALRGLHGQELMAFQGWHHGFWNSEEELPAHELMSNLAGNAFSLFALGPCLLALFLGYDWKKSSNGAAAEAHTANVEECAQDDDNLGADSEDTLS